MTLFTLIVELLSATAQQQKTQTALRSELRKPLDLPQLTFDSFSMWADEKEAKLLVVYEGQLLELPLR